MANVDPRIDAYIRKSPDFAKPILEHLREVIHAGCPDLVETIKWSRPFFDYNGPLCGFAAFKAHCALHFWKGDLVLPTDTQQRDAMGQFGRITSVADLPPKRALIAMVKQAARLNEEGVAAPWQEKRAKARTLQAAKPVVVPQALAGALAKNRKARVAFDAFSPSHKREYIEWISSAKREDTRARRLTQAVAQIAEGKKQNWRHETPR
jgi:uncharacterized protein YdeI (YjbR/CyaY-like superfamily)